MFKLFAQLESAWNLLANPIQHYPSHLRHVATLPWENKNSSFLDIFSNYGRKCKQIAFYCLWLCYSSTNFDIFGVSNSEFFPKLMEKKFSCHCSFNCLLLRSICVTGNSSQQTSLQCLSTINMIFSDEHKILTKTHKYTQHTQLHA